MSSNIEIQKICLHCGNKFIAKKTSTKFCSVPCAQRNYKIRERLNKVATGNKDTREMARGLVPAINITADQRDFIDIGHLSYVTSISKRTIFRLLKDPQFPRIKIGSRLVFNQKQAIQYLHERFGNGGAK